MVVSKPIAWRIVIPNGGFLLEGPTFDRGVDGDSPGVSGSGLGVAPPEGSPASDSDTAWAARISDQEQRSAISQWGEDTLGYIFQFGSQKPYFWKQSG